MMGSRPGRRGGTGWGGGSFWPISTAGGEWGRPGNLPPAQVGRRAGHEASAAARETGLREDPGAGREGGGLVGEQGQAVPRGPQL